MNYENLRLEKGMYRVTGKSFTQVLEELDPSINYKGTHLEGLDAFQRQLKRFDIKVSGGESDMVEKFFSTADSAALFPEYISRAVRQGLEENDALSRIIATKTKINGLDYRTIETTTADLDLAEVDEGNVIETTTISTQENLINLTKRGRMLEASYEAIRFQKLDLITVTLKQIGAHIATTLLGDAINVLKSGDGNNNAITTYNTSAAGSVTYSDLLSLWSALSPYQLNCILASPEMMHKLLSIEEFRDSAAGLSFHATGRLITPFGAELINCNKLNKDELIGLDRRYALEMVQSGDVLVESDKLIDRQIERTAITLIAGFSKIFTDASAVLSKANA